ncbi:MULTISPECIES: NAD-dependent epimerase/dehydratase family protein [Pseudomonas]|uniref:NAD dependent epimerase/dehydratase family protein n=1 Tax=Pseudomonas fluorescens TaxID=294 RepID=A0A109LIL0_PSEFL|nr:MULTISPECIES: NAD-dependent epimerase/dehydratase family protein [Pseudomonas]KWV88020.1 NAD dependent epimerase/dehydratase family protein [Pseudomonas fluorescens]
MSKVLVLGATGGIGGEVARQLSAAGWEVRALTRDLIKARSQNPVFTWLKGDALNRDDVIAAARGCAVIVHGVNPPGYRKWAEWVLPMIDNSIAGAICEGATVVLPGTVYNFGPDAFPVLHEDSPQHPLTRKGAIRVQMEQRLRAASTQGARVVIVRAGDFFGARVANNWFAQGLVKPGKPVHTIRYPGDYGVAHQWAYLPDVARTMLELIERRASLGAFACFHMAGYMDADGTQMAKTIQRVVLRRTGQQPRVGAFPWWLLNWAAPFVVTVREMQEMRYLWQTPLRLDNQRLLATLGHEPHTPLEQAVEATLVGLGCLPTCV